MSSNKQILPDDAYTMYPGDPRTAQAARHRFEEWNGPFDGRYIVRFPQGAPPITDRWTEHRAADGTTVAIRRKDCGADCRCAAEFRILP